MNFIMNFILIILLKTRMLNEDFTKKNVVRFYINILNDMLNNYIYNTFLLNSFYINILIQQNKKFSDICFLFIANNKCDIYYNYSNNSNTTKYSN